MKNLLLLLALSLTAFAQAAPTLARLYAYRPAPGAGAEFYDLQEDNAALYKANKSPITRLAWTSLAGTPTFYMFVPIQSLADLNEPTWLSKQGTDMERTGRQMRLTRSAAATEMLVLASVPELTWDETPDGPPDAFASVSVIRVKPGRVQAFITAAKEVNATTKQMGKAKSIYAHRTRYGGNSYEFHMVTGYASQADITTNVQEVQKLMGEAKYAAYLKSNAENVETIETNLIRYRPEFSHIPAK
jgi:hypothetical protein